jgi:hypothetical protein
VQQCFLQQLLLLPTMHHVMQVLHCIQGHALIMLHFIEGTVVSEASCNQSTWPAFVVVSKRFAVGPSVGSTDARNKPGGFEKRESRHLENLTHYQASNTVGQAVRCR